MKNPFKEKARIRITRAFRWDLIGIAFFSLSTFIVTLIGANLMGEEDMGRFAYLTTILGYLILSIQFGYDPLVRRFYPRFSNDPEAFRALNQRLFAIRVLFVALILSALGIVWLFYPEFLFQRIKLTTELAIYLAIFLLLYGIIDYLQIFYVAAFEQKRMQTINIIIEAIRLPAISIGVYYFRSLSTFLLIFALLFALKLVLYWIYSPINRQHHWGEFSVTGNLSDRIRSVVSTTRLFFYGANAYIQRWFIFIAGRDLDLLMIGLMVTAAGGKDAQFVFIYKIAYDLAEHTQSILLKGIAGGMGHSLISEYYEAGDYSKLKKIYHGTLELLALTTWPIAFGLAILIPDILPLLIKVPDFENTMKLIINLTVIFSISYPIFKLSSLGGTFFPATDNEYLMLIYRAGFSGLNIVSNLVLFYVFKLELYSFAISTVVIGALMVIVESFFLRWKLKLSFPFGTYFRFFIAAAIMAGAIIAFRETYWEVGLMQKLPYVKAIPSLIAIFGQIIAGALIYFIALVIFKPFNHDTLRMMNELKLPGSSFAARLLGYRQ